jgi:hypothetical protein
LAQPLVGEAQERARDQSRAKKERAGDQGGYSVKNIVHSLLSSYYSSEPGITDRWYKFASAYFAFADTTSLYFVKDPTDDEKSQLKCHLKDVKKYFSDNKMINWDRLTPDMSYDAELWVKINEINDLYGDRVSEIITDVLKLPIKVF